MEAIRGSLLRRKQEQWAKEKEEVESKQDWFPFGPNGSPGGGNPNKRHEAIDYGSVQSTSGRDREEHRSSVGDAGADEPDPNCPAARILAAAEDVRMDSRAHDGVSAALPSQPLQYPGYAVPVPPEYWQSLSTHPLQLAYPPIPVPFHMIPPGAIPIPPPKVAGGAETSTSTPAASYAEQWGHMIPQWPPEVVPGAVPLIPFGGASSVSTPYPMLRPQELRPSDGGRSVTTTVDQPRPLATAIVYPMCSPVAVPVVDDITKVSHETQTASSTAPSTNLSSLSGCRARAGSAQSDISFEEQIEERHKKEREVEEMERAEAERVRREREERETQRKRLEEREREEELAKERERDRIQQQVIEALEKAKKEAELLKKAKLHRHVLEGDPNQGRSLLGDEGDRILKEVNAFKRQQQREFDEIRSSRTPEKQEHGNRKSRSTSASQGDDRPIRPAVAPSTPSSLQRRTPLRSSMRVVGTRPKTSVTQRSNSAERSRASRIPTLPRAPQNRRSELADDPEEDVNHGNQNNHENNSSTASSSGSESTEERVMAIAAVDESERTPERVQRSFSRPPPGPWCTSSARKPNDIVFHSANIRQLSADQPPSRTRSRQSSVDPTSLLFGYTPIRRGRMRVSAEEPGETMPNDALRGSVDSNDASSSGSVSPAPRPHSQKSPSIPSISVHDSDTENRFVNNNNNHEKVCSIAHTPVAHLGRPRSVSNTPVFHKRLGELGALKNVNAADAMSPEQRRLAESRFPSMERLRASMQNLSTVEEQDRHSRPSSPLLDRFKSRAPQYRSFNLKKTTEKQTVVLEKLGALRDRLREKDNFQERVGFGATRLGSMASIRTGMQNGH